MPTPNATVSLYELIDKTATVAVKMGSGSLTVTYRPDRLTPARAQRLSAAAETESVGQAVSILLQVVTDWDLGGPLTDADGSEIVAAGELVPLTAEAMVHVPGPILNRIVTGVMEHANPNPQTAGSSGGGSFTRQR